ncbi:glycosyltransferase family 4 protein [Acinetobacter sp. YH12085]|uniref:glycosyltransferase family 4 protein n=1 Tax=Acinetobacter sp. YH12085 TaxID=2601077 RepID=UPI0015D388C2|nr:glycosyltransferase family 4 protein [Acinetobacter sp. YH12085]
MKNICFITTDFPPELGGVASHAHELAKALVKIGQKVYVICPRVENTPEYEVVDGIEVYRPILIKQKPFYTWQLKNYLKKFLKKHTIDFIHIHGMRPLEATKDLNLPIVFTNHTSGFLKRLEKPKWRQGRLAVRLSHVDLVLAPSYELCDATKKVGYDGPVHFVSNGVDTKKFTAINPFNFPQKIKFLLARRLHEKNGVIVFAQAITLMKSQNFEVVIAGGGTEREKMEEILASKGCLQKVTFLGPMSNKDMPEVYKQVQFSVLPSFYEATSITGLESMATGLPLVGTNVGGIPYLIKDGQTGYLVPSHDAQALADKMDEVIEIGAERYAQLSQASRQRAEQFFDWSVIARETLSYYEGLQQ